MKIAILGTGAVGKTLAGKLASLGHEVAMGTRDPSQTLQRTDPDMAGEPPVSAWLKEHESVRLVPLSDAARDSEIIINAISGAGVLAALQTAGAANLEGKILIDVSNPLDFSNGMPPTLSVCNTDSLGEQVQEAFPGAKVVKTLNTINVVRMVEPKQLAGGDHTMFVAGNDSDAKTTVTRYLKEWFGWEDVLDIGGISSARGTEMLLPIWLRIYGAFESPNFAFKVVR